MIRRLRKSPRKRNSSRRTAWKCPATSKERSTTSRILRMTTTGMTTARKVRRWNERLGTWTQMTKMWWTRRSTTKKKTGPRRRTRRLRGTRSLKMTSKNQSSRPSLTKRRERGTETTPTRTRRARTKTTQTTRRRSRSLRPKATMWRI
eukprot:Rmarinus@m.5339